MRHASARAARSRAETRQTCLSSVSCVTRASTVRPIDGCGVRVGAAWRAGAMTAGRRRVVCIGLVTSAQRPWEARSIMSRQPQPQFDRRALLGRTGVGAGALALGAPGLLDAAGHPPKCRGGNRRAVEALLEGYRRAWVRRDPDAAAALFTPDAVYQEQA